MVDLLVVSGPGVGVCGESRGLFGVFGAPRNISGIGAFDPQRMTENSPSMGLGELGESTGRPALPKL